MFTKLDLFPLVTTKILSKVGNSYRANVQVFPLDNKFFCTDFNYSIHRKKGNTFLTEKDGVWGILPEETPVIAKNTHVQKGDLVLDLATGCGMIAIFCAEKAKKVIATDINPKAINYAHFNAILNNVEDKIEFRIGDLFEPIKNLKFDLIIWNGPTVAVPKTNGKYPIYSDGGLDGALFTRKFIDQAFDYLNSSGRLQWYDCAMGTRELPVTMTYAKNAWKNRNIKLSFKSLTSSPVDLKKSFKLYSKYNLENNKFQTPLAYKPVTIREDLKWKQWLKANGLTHFYYAFVEVVQNNKFKIAFNFPKKDIRTDRYLIHFWLFMSYPTLKRKLNLCQNL